MQVTLQQFKIAFEAAFVVNRKHLLWNTKARRTALMTAYIYRTISESFLGTTLEYEYKDIDAVLLSEGDSVDNVQVAIEHENVVQGIGVELKHLREMDCPLSVLITYTGFRQEYITKRHSEALRQFNESSLLLILNKENWSPESHEKGHAIPWEFFTVGPSGILLQM